MSTTLSPKSSSTTGRWLCSGWRDNGVGFDIHQEHCGMELDSPRARVESLHDKFSIQSEPGQGTRICLPIPIDEKKIS